MCYTAWFVLVRTGEIWPYPGSVTTLPDLLGRLRGQGRPRLTWYGDERVELSGDVLDNWVTKTAHLLHDELAAHRDLLDLPAHWRSVVWALAALRLGAGVATTTTGAGHAPEHRGADASDATVVVTDAPDQWPTVADLVVVALPALARTAGAVPAGAVDANAAVMTYPDASGPWSPPDPARIALERPAVSHGDLLAWAVRTAPVERGRRVLAAGGDPLDLLAITLSALVADASVVLGPADWAAGLLADPVDRKSTRLNSSH